MTLTKNGQIGQGKERMSRRHGGRPGYGWSLRQQGGYRPPSPVRYYRVSRKIEPTSEHSIKSNLERARKEGWSVNAKCHFCGREGKIKAQELILKFNLSKDMRLEDIKNKYKEKTCPNCKRINTTRYHYTA